MAFLGREVKVSIVGDSRDVEKAFARSGKAAQDFNRKVTQSYAPTSSRRQAIGMAGGYLAVGAAASGAAAFLRSSVDAALEAEKAQTRLRSAVDAAGLNFDQYSGRIQRVIQETSLLAALDDEDLSDSFARLVRTTGSVTKATEGMALAADIARARGIELSAATNIVEKAHVGQLRGLKSVGVQIGANTTSTEALALAQQKFAGAAQRYGESNAAAVDRLAVSFENLQEAIGAKALPFLATFVETLNDGILVAGKFGDGIDRINEELDKMPGGFGFEIDWGAALGAVPGAQQAKILADAIGDVADRYRDLQEVAARPLDFTPLKRLTEGMEATTPGFPSYPYTGPKGTPGGSVEQRNQWFDTKIGRQTERAESIADLQKIAKQLEARIKATKDITRRNKLMDDLWRINQQIEERTAAKQKDAADARETRRKAAAEAERQRIETKFGWLDFAIERAAATKTVADDLKAFRALEATLEERIRQEGRTLDLVSRLWRVREDIKKLNEKNADGDPLAGLMQVSSKQLAAQLAAGTGLTGAGRRVLGANISGAQIQNYVSVELDGQQVARSVTTRQTRTGKRTGKQTSGAR